MCYKVDAIRVHHFAERYFSANDCQIIERSPHHLKVKLSVKVDKELINRPFYWMYVEKMNLQPNPATLNLISKPEKAPDGFNGELLSFGTPRFTQILQSAINQGRFIRLYEDKITPEVNNPASSSPYIPWLGVNYKLSYICDQKKDELLSLGMNLYDGKIKNDFYPLIKQRSWTPKIPAHRHTIRPRIKLMESLGQLEHYVEEHIKKQDSTWAREAKKRLDQELKQLSLYYPEWESEVGIETEKKQRIQEIYWQYYPRIEVDTINAGLFFLDPS